MVKGGPGIRIRWSWVLFLFLVLAPPSLAAEPDPSGLAFRQRQGSQAPLDAAFTDAAGHPTTLGAALGGHPTVLQLGYFACPSLCGVSRDDTLAALAGSGLRAGTDYSYTFVAIDPAETPREAAAALQADMARYKVPGEAEALHYLTGPSSALAESVGFPSRYDTMLKQFLHPSGIIILTPDGVVSSYLLGVGYTAPDMRAALVQAGQHVVAPAIANPILLLCFHYDSTTGRYTFAIMKVLRLMAGITVVAAVGTVAWLRRSERKRA